MSGYNKPYQTVIFQRKLGEPEQYFLLKTATYEVRCASFLSIKTLLQKTVNHEN